MKANILKKQLKQVSCLILAGILLAGCADGKKKETALEAGNGTEAGIGTKVSGEREEYPADSFVRWAVPDDKLAWVSDDTLEAVNARLREDGYSFGLKFVPLAAGDILESLKQSGADIVTFEPDVREQIAEKAQAAGIFEPLDERLAGSRLYDEMPELCWECVRYRGSICYVPNEHWADDGMHLYVRKDLAPGDLLTEFDGDIFNLRDYLSADTPMYYGIDDFQFAETFGYAFDSVRGLLFTEDGSCINPLEDERVVEWLRTVNLWYHEGKLQMDYRELEKCPVVFMPLYTAGAWQSDYCWKGYAKHRTACPTGILASSGKKDDAFVLLELLHTDHDYGNLLIYGKNAPDTGEIEGSSYFYKSFFGLDTGLRRQTEGERYFSSAAEKKLFYEQNILPSPSLYLDFPDKCKTVAEIEIKYMCPEQFGNGKIRPETSILTCDDFDARLQEFRAELQEPMDEVLRKLSES